MINEEDIVNDIDKIINENEQENLSKEDKPIENEQKVKSVSIDSENIHDEKEESHNDEKLKKLISKLNKEKRLSKENKKALEEREEYIKHLISENEKLKEYSADAYIKAAEGHEGRIKSGIELAKEEYKKCIDNNDVEGMIDAQNKLIQLSVRLEKIEDDKYLINENKKIQDNKKSEKTEQYNNKKEPYDPEKDTNIHMSEWVKRNPDVNPNSIDYDADLVEELNVEAMKLNLFLKKKGREDLIGGQDYFRKLDEYMKKIKSEDSSTLGGYLGKSSSSNKIVGVKSTNSIYNQYRNVELDDDQKQMAKHLRISEDDFKKYYVNSMKSKQGAR